MTMTSKTVIKQITCGDKTGKWAKFDKTGRSYFLATVADTRDEAWIAAIKLDAYKADQFIDRVEQKLRRLGVVTEADGRSWLF